MIFLELQFKTTEKIKNNKKKHSKEIFVFKVGREKIKIISFRQNSLLILSYLEESSLFYLDDSHGIC